jgi:4-amino-4-deoxy-L-arabinose transferase-like glycosyltransferase
MSPRTRIRALAVAIFLVGLTLRLYHLDRFPERNRTADEYAWTWSGMTLLTEGTPRAWSWLGGYPGFPVIKWRDNDYRIVKPWLDHPPLYPIFVGAFMLVSGTHDIFAVELLPMRLSTMLLFIIAYWLFYIVLLRYEDATLTLLTLAFWGVAPTAVWNGRLVMAEQLMLPLALLGWLALDRFGAAKTPRQRRGWLIALGLACALLPLCKTAACAFVLWLFALAIRRADRRAAVVIAAGAICGCAIYLGYGAHYGWHLFRTILQVQGARFTNFGGFNALIFAPRVVEKPFMYLPFLLGFFVLLSDLRAGRHVELGLFVAVYAVGIAFLLPWNGYGWYLIPLYPALAFGLASFVLRAWRDAAADAFWIWLLFSVTYLCWIVCDAGVGSPQLWRWVYIVIAALTALTSRLAARFPSRWRAAFGVFVGAQLLGDCWYVLRR